MNKTMHSMLIEFQEYLKQELKNPIVKKHYDAYGEQLEIAYAILQLRKRKKMSQAQLAKTLGTTQSNVARMESGQQNFTTETLHNIALVFGQHLKIEFVAR